MCNRFEHARFVAYLRCDFCFFVLRCRVQSRLPEQVKDQSTAARWVNSQPERPKPLRCPEEIMMVAMVVTFASGPSDVVIGRGTQYPA